MDLSSRTKFLNDACISTRSSHYWLGLSDIPLTRKGANKFLLGAIIDYQIKADKAWERANWIAEEHFKGADDIWSLILQYSPDDWYAFCKSNSVHRFPKAYERIQRIGAVIEERYLGDARNIWQGVAVSEVMNRLQQLRLGEQISNMVLGALFDTGQVHGALDVKADVHVSRVIGRVLLGKEANPNQALSLARQVHPDNPWLLDWKLFMTGRQSCHRSSPKCTACNFNSFCTFYSVSVEAIGNGK